MALFRADKDPLRSLRAVFDASIPADRGLRCGGQYDGCTLSLPLFAGPVALQEPDRSRSGRARLWLQVGDRSVRSVGLSSSELGA